MNEFKDAIPKTPAWPTPGQLKEFDQHLQRVEETIAIPVDQFLIDPFKAFDHMTPTARELMASPRFWIARIEQQVEYVARFDNTERTQPNAYKIKFGAIDILEVCQLNAITAAPTAFEKGIVSAAIENIGRAQPTPQGKGGNCMN